MFKEYITKIHKKIQEKKSKSYERKSHSHSFTDALHIFSNQEEFASSNSYQTNVIVHRCIDLISVTASHVPWKVYQYHTKGLAENPTHPANFLLKKPNSEKAGADFFTEVIASLLLYGNSYIATLQNENASPKSLHFLHPNAIDTVIRNNQLIAYKYKPAPNIKEVLYPVDTQTSISRILHIKNYHPNNSLQGLSPLKAATKAILLHNQTMDWNKSLLSNSTKPSGVLAFQDGNGYLTDEQFERLQQQFYENFTGSRNSGKPLILEGGLKWQDTNNAEKAEKFLELKDSSARDIAIAFNIPPQLLGLNGDNTYSNMQEARLSLWEENLIPLLDKLSDALTNWLSYWYRENLVIDFDRDSISALTKKRENLWSKISSASFMTINEKRAFVGLPPINNGNQLESTK